MSGMQDRLDDQARERADAQARTALAQEQAQIEARRAEELRSFVDSPAFAYVREVVDPLLLNAISASLSGHGDEVLRAQGEYSAIEKILKAFGCGVSHGIGRLQEVQVRHPESQEGESPPSGPTA